MVDEGVKEYLHSFTYLSGVLLRLEIYLLRRRCGCVCVIKKNPSQLILPSHIDYYIGKQQFKFSYWNCLIKCLRNYQLFS